MSLNTRLLQSIQQAGQSIHESRELLKAEVARHTEHLVSVMATQPLGPVADSSFGQLKLVARMHQEMQALEDQLRGIYQTATQLKGADVQVIEALPHRRTNASATADRVEDAQVVTPAPRRKPGRKPTAEPAPAAAPTKRRGGRVGTNDDKVLAALRRLLKASKTATLSQAQIATEAGIPVGSIAASLHRLQEATKITQIARGRYKLARGIASPGAV